MRKIARTCARGLMCSMVAASPVSETHSGSSGTAASASALGIASAVVAAASSRRSRAQITRDGTSSGRWLFGLIGNSLRSLEFYSPSAGMQIRLESSRTIRDTVVGRFAGQVGTLRGRLSHKAWFSGTFRRHLRTAVRVDAQRVRLVTGVLRQCRRPCERPTGRVDCAVGCGTHQPSRCVIMSRMTHCRHLQTLSALEGIGPLVRRERQRGITLVAIVLG